MDRCKCRHGKWSQSTKYSVSNRHHSIAQLLLSKGADINVCKKNGPSPLYMACLYGIENIVQLLLINRADINLCTMFRLSPLYIACRNEHEHIVKLLLSYGANINLCT